MKINWALVFIVASVHVFVAISPFPMKINVALIFIVASVQVFSAISPFLVRINFPKKVLRMTLQIRAHVRIINNTCRAEAPEPAFTP